MFSPLLWTTVATGKPPTQHGIADFLVKDPATGQRRPMTSDFRKCKALWNILGDLDLDSGWIAWWASYPAEEIRGAMVTELLAFTTVRKGPDEAAATPALASPEGYLSSRKSLLVPPSAVTFEEVRDLIPVTSDEVEQAKRRAPLEQLREDSKEPPDPVTFIVKLLAATRTYHAVALDMLRSDMPVVSVYYEGIDMMGHRFQHYLPPRMTIARDEETARFKDAVPNFYALQDRMLGELISAAGPATDVVILSDHGFRSGDDRPPDILPFTTGQPAEWHRPWGILAMAGPSIRPGKLPPTSLYDVAPTLLFLAGLPGAEDMPGRVIAEGIRADLLRSRPTERIRSYELVGEPLARRSVPAASEEAMEELVANLRALGYVGAEAASPPRAPTASSPSTDEPEGESGGETQVFFHRNLAVSYIKQGDLASAERELLLANERQPFPKSYAMLSEIRARQGRFAEAAAALEDGLRAVGGQMEPDVYLWLVETYLRAGDRVAARAVPERFRTLMPEGIAAGVTGLLAEAEGRPDAARSEYERALASRPLLTGVAMRLSRLYAAEGRPDAIAPFLDRGIAINPRADSYHQLIGELAMARGDARAAYERFRIAVDVQPENGLYLGQMATAAAALGKRDEARARLEWAERWSPTEPAAWMAIGSAWDRLGEVDRAIAAFQKARETGIEGPGADIGSALALARAGRTAEARRLLADARRRFPESEALAGIAKRLGG
jgi:tetratricopeptide (TPR) repeat protein